MNPNLHNPNSTGAVFPAKISTGEETLRLIASLPAPEGLEDRVHAAVRSGRHSGRLFAWPAPLRPGSDWMRAAAAAAIAFIVAGGGWGVYLRVEQGQAKLMAMPPHIAAPGSFAGAGAMRTPQTLNGPVLVHPLPAAPVNAPSVQEKPAATDGKTAKKAATPAAAPSGQRSRARAVAARPASSAVR